MTGELPEGTDAVTLLRSRADYAAEWGPPSLADFLRRVVGMMERESAARATAEARVRELEADKARLDKLEAELLEEDGSEIRLRFDEAGVETFEGHTISHWPRTFSVNDGADYEIYSTLRAALDAHQAARQAGEVEG